MPVFREWKAGALASALLVLIACGNGEPPAPAADAPLAAESSDVIADAAIPDLPLRVELLGVSRTAPEVLHLRLALVNTSDRPFDLREAFPSGDGELRPLTDVYLLDEAGHRKYFVVRDDGNRPLCSRNLEMLEPYERRLVWARFPMPSGEVGSVGVHWPGVAAFEGVAIEAPGSAPASRTEPPASRRRLDGQPGLGGPGAVGDFPAAR